MPLLPVQECSVPVCGKNCLLSSAVLLTRMSLGPTRIAAELIVEGPERWDHLFGSGGRGGTAETPAKRCLGGRVAGVRGEQTLWIPSPLYLLYGDRLSIAGNSVRPSAMPTDTPAVSPSPGELTHPSNTVGLHVGARPGSLSVSWTEYGSNSVVFPNIFC